MGQLMETAALGYRNYLETRGCTKKTVSTYMSALRHFMNYCRGKGIRTVDGWDRECISGYIEALNSLPLAKATKERHMLPVRNMIRYTVDADYLLVDPFVVLEYRLKGTRKERPVLSEEEMARLIDGIPTATWEGIRDKSMFELLYQTGMRVNELAQLNKEDIDSDHNEVRILQGKGRKQRIVPLCGKAKEAMVYWLYRVRGSHARDGCAAVYVNRNGWRLSAQTVTEVMKAHSMRVGLSGKGYAPHSIRHSCATHLLAHGADIRYVQELLGHSSIETTAQYTRQEKARLKQLHKMYHPRENELYHIPEELEYVKKTVAKAGEKSRIKGDRGQKKR